MIQPWYTTILTLMAKNGGVNRKGLCKIVNLAQIRLRFVKRSLSGRYCLARALFGSSISMVVHYFSYCGCTRGMLRFTLVYRRTWFWKQFTYYICILQTVESKVEVS